MVAHPDNSAAASRDSADAEKIAAEIYSRLSIAASERPLDAAEMEEFNGLIRSFPSLDRLLGAEFVALEPRRVEMRLRVRADHLQPGGVTNGGTYAALGETAGSVASFIAAGARGVVFGTNNSTDFLRPSTQGDVIHTVATPEHVGRNTQLWRIEHRNEETDKVLALTRLKTTVMGDQQE